MTDHRDIMKIGIKIIIEEISNFKDQEEVVITKGADHLLE